MLLLFLIMLRKWECGYHHFLIYSVFCLWPFPLYQSILYLSSIFPSFKINVFTSIFLSTYLSLYLSIYLSTYLLIYLISFLSICKSNYLSIYLYIYLSIYLSTNDYLSNAYLRPYYLSISVIVTDGTYLRDRRTCPPVRRRGRSWRRPRPRNHHLY